ncbi:alkaline phosphatase-like protein [Polychaeton citri CBS 116435]|uniref:Alkaline phosphatase-like protein n=1 Tax=Polychaeton citri CBS 116435 TaxID=1314669 RepID=A0A9P4UT67_9PEZI|nr:alkaline phosphatase-like protein [Polychaeton citri CBS 116435]
MTKLRKLLIDEGTHFTNHFAHISQCCPSRVSLWTGRHPHNTNITDVKNGSPGGGWKHIQTNGKGLWHKCLPVYLQQEGGYRTYYAGKLYNGMDKSNYASPHAPAGWTEVDFLLHPSVYSYYESSFQNNKGSTHPPPTVKPGYSTDEITDLVKGYVDDALGLNQAFFAVAAPVSPHISTEVSCKEAGVKQDCPVVGEFDPNAKAPYPIPKRDHLDLYKDRAMPKHENFNPKMQTGVNQIWRLEEVSGANEKLLDEYKRNRQRALKSVDDMVESFVQHLEKKNAMENTWIIYTSDNGYHLGQHRLQGGKNLCYEEDTNVPLIIRGPGMAKGLATDLVTGHIDLAPTVLSLAGVKLRDEWKLDGEPIQLPLENQSDIDAAKLKRGEHVNIEHWASTSTADVIIYKALRVIGPIYNLMYSVWCTASSSPSANAADIAHELYDMTADPYQVKNIHPDAPNPSGAEDFLGRPNTQVLRRLDALMLVLKTCAMDTCRHPWRALHHNGSVDSLSDALDESHDDFYHQLQQRYVAVGWITCLEGRPTLYDFDNERPIWGEDVKLDSLAVNASFSVMQTFTS